MSDANQKKELTHKDDPELNELLDNTLKDFDNQLEVNTEKDDKNKKEVVKLQKEDTNVVSEALWTQDFVNDAAEDFKKNLESFAQYGGANLEESLKKIAQNITGSLESDGEDVSLNFQTAINQALKDLTSSSENLSNVPNLSEDLAGMFSQTSLNDPSEDIFPFMQGMMQSLLSKDVLYPSLKDIVDKYPSWLIEKKEKLDVSELERYEKQFILMKKVCAELESEKEDDTDEVKRKRFEQTLGLMQEMQGLGQPPQDLIGDQQPIFSTDSDGNPVVLPIPGLQESPNCCVM